MRQQQKERDAFLQEILIMEKKLFELRALVEGNQNGVRLEDAANRASKAAKNFEKKMKSFQKGGK